MNRFLVTGATGFVGHFVCNKLLADGQCVRGTLLESESPTSLVEGVEPVVIEPLGSDTQLHHALSSIDTIIHLAARVHIMDDKSTGPLTEFRKVNVEGTARLAREAAKAGAKRFVYGPGVKANFLNMMKIISRGIPLPLTSIANKRSLINVGNLVDALAVCATHPAAAGKTYLVSDGEDVSTPELIRRTAAALEVPARVSLMGSGTKTQGIILCNQVRMLDFKERGGKLVEVAPVIIVEEVLARARTLLD
jgi:nucleoside-diphosphate-sugar epimerase